MTEYERLNKLTREKASLKNNLNYYKKEVEKLRRKCYFLEGQVIDLSCLLQLKIDEVKHEKEKQKFIK